MALEASDWERFLQRFPQAHILQTVGWGDLKSEFGWNIERICVEGTGAQVLFRNLPLGFSIAYLPKGPVGEDWKALLSELDRICRKRRAIVLKVEPDGWEEDEAALAQLLPGFTPGGIPVQPRRTIVIRLDGDEASWLERMKPKTRYNIRLAERKNVVVHSSSDVDSFYRLMQVTGGRDGFGVHSLAYYQRAYTVFHERGAAELLIAEFEGRPLAGLLVFAQGKRSWYFYGASNDEERNRMPTYALQWEAMRWAAAHGCSEYDLWGVPDEGEDILEGQFESRSDGLWGVYRFKRGFGGQVKRAASTWEKVYITPMYHFYRWYALRAHRRED
jgi:peptidoglycan pentaglycine glycine transferase (the first glycine)